MDRFRTVYIHEDDGVYYVGIQWSKDPNELVNQAQQTVHGVNDYHTAVITDSPGVVKALRPRSNLLFRWLSAISRSDGRATTDAGQNSRLQAAG